MPQNCHSISEMMLIFVNPGSVRFHLGENTQPCPIWNGPIDIDDRYDV